MGKMLEVLEEQTNKEGPPFHTNNPVSAVYHLKITDLALKNGEFRIDEAFGFIEMYDLAVGEVTFHDVKPGMQTLWPEDMQAYLKSLGASERLWGAAVQYSSKPRSRESLPLRAVLRNDTAAFADKDNAPSVTVYVYG
jgi:hypothetical protein